MASFCVSSGNVGLCVRTLKGKTVGRETGRDGSSMQHHLFPFNLDEWWWILPPTLSLKGSDVLFYHSKQVFILEGASKTMKCNSFIVQIEEPCLWELFIKVTKVPDHGDWQDVSTEIMAIIHTHLSTFFYGCGTVKYCPYATEILPYLTILRKKPKERRNYGLRTSCHGNLSELQVHLALSSTVTPWSHPGKVGPGQNPHQQGHLQSQP